MKSLLAEWTPKNGRPRLRWKLSKTKGLHYCPNHGMQQTKKGQCTVCRFEHKIQAAHK